MTGRERIFAYLEGKPTDRIPNLSIIKAVAARLVGIPYGLYCTDYKYLVEAYMLCCERFGVDTTNVMSDPLREAADFGADVEFSENAIPRLREPFIKEKDDIKKLKPYNPYEAPRAVNTCKAIELFRKVAGDRLAVCGIVEMPFAEAVTLRGMQNLMYDLYDEPRFVTDMMDIILDAMKSYILAQIKAGADIIWYGDSAASLVSPKIYSGMILPYEKEMIKFAHENGKLTRLHICGNINHLLAHMTETGADIIDFDWMVDAGDATAIFGSKTFLAGNLDPVAMYLEGTPELIRREVFKLSRINHKTLFISSGCEIPEFAPEENIIAHKLALEEIGGKFY